MKSLPSRYRCHCAGVFRRALLAGLLPFAAHAATKTWDGGAATSNWGDAANWAADGVPTSSDAVVLNNLAVNPVPQINAQSGANCGTLTIDGVVAAGFLNYAGSTPLVTNLYGASVNAANTGPLFNMTVNAPASELANKVNFRLQTNGELFVAAGKTFTLGNSIISQGGTRSLTKSGAGTVQFSGSGSEVQFTGGFNMAEGTWNAGADTLDLPTSGIITFTNASGVAATITSTNSHSIGGLAGGNGNSEFYATGTTGLTLTGSAVTTFSGRIRGATKLNYSGTGSLTLNGNNTFTGATSINSGTLALGASGSLDSTASVSLASGATFNVSAIAAGFTVGSGKTLSGGGTVTGKLTAASGATVAPAGLLTVSNGFTAASGVHLVFGITSAASYDAIAVAGGNVSLTGDLAGTTLGYTPAIGDTLYLVRNNGAGTTTGTLNGIGDGGKLDLGGKWFRVSFTSNFGGSGFAVGGSGNDVAIQRINDPSPSGPVLSIVGATNEANVTLQFSWLDNATTETGYLVYRVLADGSLELLSTLAANATTFTDTVGNYTSYTYAVQAITATGPLGDLTYTAPFQAGSSFEERKGAVLDYLNTATPNLGQSGAGPHRIGRTGFWFGEGRLLRGDTANGLSYITAAVEDASAEGPNTGFSMWPGMDAYLRWGQLFSQTLKDRYQQIYTTSDLYDNSATPNQRFMTCTASYLANSVWGSAVNSVSSAGYGTADPSGKVYLENVINAMPFHGYPEHDANHYLLYTLAPMRTLADFAPDPVFKNKARMAFDWGMAEGASAWLNGHWGVASTRGQTIPQQNNYDIMPQVWWLIHGGPTPSDMGDAENSTIFTMPPFAGVLPEISAAATQRTQSYTRRTFAQKSDGPQIAYFKQTWMTPRYALWSQAEGTVSGFNADGSIILQDLDAKAIYSGYQGQRWGMAWDDPPNGDSALRITTPTTYSGTTGGTSIYEDTLQREDTMLAVYNIPTTGGPGGNNGDFPNQWLEGHIPAGYLAITNEAATTGRIFLHYNSVLISVYLSNPFSWTTDFTTPCVKAGLAIETAPVSEYPQSTASARLAAFRTAVLAHAPDIGAISAAAPRLVYTNRHGDVLDLTYGLAGKINGVTVDYQSWPMLEDPWMYQAQQGHLHIFGDNRTVTSNYYDWTQTINNRPVISGNASVAAVAGSPVDVDLSARVADSETPDANLFFEVSNPTGGTVALLADGRTARFTPTAGSSGAAAFDFTARDRGLHPRIVWHYDFEPPATLATNLVRDASGQQRDAALSFAGAGTAALEANSPAALGANSTQSLHCNETASTAARLQRTVTRSNLEMSNGSWTFATWFKRGSRTTDDFLFYIGSGDGFGGSGDELQLRCGANSDTLRLEHYNAANVGDLTLVSPGTAVQNVWHHAAITFEKTADNTGTVRLYLNGTLVGTPTSVTWSLRQDLPLVIGGIASTSASVISRYFGGWLDDTALFRGAMTDPEIASLARQSVATFSGLSASATVPLSVLTQQQSWRQQYLGTTANTGTAADLFDANGDGEVNLLEFATAQNPNAATLTQPALVRNGATLEFTYTRSLAAMSDGVTFTVEWSDTLLNDWSTTGVSAPTVLSDNGTVQSMKATLPAGSNRRFVRLKVVR